MLACAKRATGIAVSKSYFDGAVERLRGHCRECDTASMERASSEREVTVERESIKREVSFGGALSLHKLAVNAVLHR